MSDKPGKSRLWPKLVAALVVVVVGLAYLRSYLKPVAKVETVFSGDSVNAAPGSVAVKEEYSMEMKSAIAGRVLSKNFKLEIGNKIKEGDTLVQLDTGDVDIEINEAKNILSSAQQKIAAGSATTYTLESAKSDFSNVERLYKMGQIAESDYAKSRRAVETIEQQQAIEKVLNEENINSDKASLEKLEREKEKMTIKAPFEGEISDVQAHPGDLINPGSAIVTLITTKRVVEAKISEEDFADIKVGQKAIIILLPYKAWRYNGVVSKILPTADPETQRHLVYLDITDIEPEKLIPGITGEVTIETGRRAAKAIIPRRALLNDNVYVVKNGVVELRPVTKGYVWLNGAEITEGLEPGEQVIVEELDSFRAGDSVKVVELPSDAIARKK
ncbi:MAG TPA: efflux RND transporter periplasmic adaptor subunit [Opitutaceae bacterium]|nr:efflux RND transporter periplasmic adaptor subunit [Opitutaceae bacterium]